jgi:TRAP-type C4-dicarboxylate transport system permease small subunit
MKFWSTAERIFDKVVDFMFLAAAVIVVVDAVVVSLDVIMRKTISFTWSPLYEIMEYSLLWMVFLGTTAIMRANTHVRMESLVGQLSPRAQALANSITSFVCVLLSIGVLGYTVRLTVHDYRTHFVLATILNPIKWPIETIIPIGFFMLCIQLLRTTRNFFMTYKTLSREKHSTTGHEAGAAKA